MIKVIRNDGYSWIVVKDDKFHAGYSSPSLAMSDGVYELLNRYGEDTVKIVHTYNRGKGVVSE
jgi:hypothetical protein